MKTRSPIRIVYPDIRPSSGGAPCTMFLVGWRFIGADTDLCRILTTYLRDLPHVRSCLTPYDLAKAVSAELRGVLTP